MSYWKYAGKHNNCPTFPGYIFGSAQDFSMVFYNDSEAPFLQSYLYIASEHVGLLSAKLTDEATYKPIMEVFDALCYVGEMVIGETTVNFRLENTTYEDVTTFTIQVFLAHDDGVSLPIPYFTFDFSHEFWATCYGNELFWADEYGMVPAEQTCDLSGSGGFYDGWEPGQFEDSFSPGLWV